MTEAPNRTDDFCSYRAQKWHKAILLRETLLVENNNKNKRVVTKGYQEKDINREGS